MRIENTYSLKLHNSLRLESTAEYYCEITNQEEAQEAIEFANNKDSSITFLGEGTNVILRPNYIGLLIKNSINQKSIENGGFYPLFGLCCKNTTKLSGFLTENKGFICLKIDRIFDIL